MVPFSQRHPNFSQRKVLHSFRQVSCSPSKPKSSTTFVNPPSPSTSTHGSLTAPSTSKHPTLIKWKNLEKQFGAHYRRSRDFRSKFCRTIENVLKHKPVAPVLDLLPEGLHMKPASAADMEWVERMRQGCLQTEPLTLCSPQHHSSHAPSRVKRSRPWWVATIAPLVECNGRASWGATVALRGVQRSRPWWGATVAPLVGCNGRALGGVQRSRLVGCNGRAWWGATVALRGVQRSRSPIS